MKTLLTNTTKQFQYFDRIDAIRKSTLQPLIDFIQLKVTKKEAVNLNFICTHNSRRSHLAQVWAQVATYHYGIPHVACYSGGTEETALSPLIAETLANQGFLILNIAAGDNPIYALKYGINGIPILGFSKKYDHALNPTSDFAAIMTCSQADTGCPFISGAAQRIAITYEDPKIADGTAQQKQVYAQRSLEIATEMHYVFSTIKL